MMRRRLCNKAPGCEWEGPRKAKKGGRCVASSGASDVVAETPAAPLNPPTGSVCSILRPRQCRFDRPSRTCVPK